MQVNLEEARVVSASTQFWEQMLAIELEQLPILEHFTVHEGHILGRVHIGGAWEGCIEVRMTEGLAKQATSAMLMQPIETVQLEDTLDATKEIANMVAGTIKSALPRPCTMTVPESQIFPDAICDFVTSDFSMMVAFRHDSGELMVRVVEQAAVVA